MPLATDNTKESEVQERGVFSTKIAPALDNGVTCDSCGRSVVARYEAVKGDQKLAFCAHHIRCFAAGLKDKQFSITPEDYTFPEAKSDNKAEAE